MNFFGPHKSSIGDMDANIISLIAYACVVLGSVSFLRYTAWMIPLVFFFIEKNSEFVKRNSMQAFVLCAISTIFSFFINIVGKSIISLIALIFSQIPFFSFIPGIATVIFGVVLFIISLILSIFAIIAAVNSYKYVEYRVPGVSFLADKIRDILKNKTGL